MKKTFAGSVSAFAGAVGVVSVSLFVEADRISIEVGFPEAGYESEVHEFDAAEDVDTYLAARFPEAWKVGMYQFGTKFAELAKF